MAKVANITYKAGFLVIDNGSGPAREIPIADILRQADIPSLSHSQVDGLRILANAIAVLIRVLIDREILDESFVDNLGLDWDLDHIIYAIEQLGGSYHSPDFDDVEDA